MPPDAVIIGQNTTYKMAIEGEKASDSLKSFGFGLACTVFSLSAMKGADFEI